MKITLSSLITVAAFLLNFSTAAAANVDFTPRISVSEEYTDNLDLDASDEKEDFITTVTPGFSLDIDARSSGLSLSYDAGYSFYDEYDEYDSWRHSASVTAWTALSRRSRLEVTDRFLYTEDPDDDDDEEDPDYTLRTGREPYYTNTASIAILHQFGEADTLELRYEYSILENEDDTEADNSRHIPSANLTWWLVPRQLSLETGLEYTRGEFTGDTEVDSLSDDFDQWEGNIRLTKVIRRELSIFVDYTHTWLDYDGEEIDYQIYDPSVGLTYTWGEDAAMTLGVGYFFQDRETGDDESGVTIDGDISKTWRFRRSSINLTGSSGYDQSYFGSENLGFDIYYMAAVSMTHEFSRHISGDAFCSYRRDEYTETEDDREDDTIEAGCGITAQLNRWLSTRLGYTFTNVDSDDREDEYTENSVILTFTLAPSSPI